MALEPCCFRLRRLRRFWRNVAFAGFFFASNVAFAGFCHICFLFWLYFSCGFSAVAFSLNVSIYVVGSPLACPLGRLGPLPHSLVGRVFSNHETTSNLVQIPWNFVEGFCTSGNPNKGNSVISKLDQTEPLYSLRIPPIFACLSHGLYLYRARG